MAAVARPRFYLFIAFAFALLIFVGFSQTYYLRPFADLPPLTALVQVHGALFTAWVAVFIVQTRLVASHRVDIHMKLGIASVALAVFMIAVGLATIAAKATLPRIHPSGLTPPQFTIVGLMSIGMFAAFLALGIAYRSKAAVHKRFMVLSMIAVLTPPSSRILSMLGQREHWTMLTPVIPTLFILVCLAYDWRKHGRVHPVYAIGGAVIAIAWPARLIIGKSEWYQPVGEWIARLGS